MSACVSCGEMTNHGGAPTEIARCALVEATRDDLVAYSQTLDHPPTEWKVANLWAHARLSHYDDGAEAARWVRTVLDLGWRPAVGGDHQ